jgi:CheY-like chemotaxis protein
VIVATSDAGLVHSIQRELPAAEVIPAESLTEASQKATEYRARLVVVDSDDDTSKEDWQVPVLQLSLPDRHRRAEAIGAQVILAKPLLREQLLQALELYASGARRILVVDDDPRFVDMVRRMLGGDSQGFETHAAHTGEEALALAVSQQFDAFLLDQSLPDIKGVDLCQQLRSLPAYTSTPVLFITAYELEMLVGQWARKATLMVPENLGGAQALRLVHAMFEALGFQGSQVAVPPAPFAA